MNQSQSLPCVSIRRICPAPDTGAPKPMFETYKAPSGPKVMPVGNVKPEATVVRTPAGLILERLCPL